MAEIPENTSGFPVHGGIVVKGLGDDSEGEPMTWFDEALYLIAEADKDAPDGMSLEERKKRVNKAKPHHFSSTSWGNKVWPKAKKAYFAAYEAKKPEIIITDFGPSPLEQARMRALRA